MKTRKFKSRDAADVSKIMIEAFSSFLKDKFDEMDRTSFLPGDIKEKSNLKAGTAETVSYVAEEKGRIVGYIRGTAFTNGLGSLEMVGVSPDVFHKGAGTMLIKTLEDFWKRKKLRKVYTCVSANNKKAIMYYLKNDFIPVGYRKDHFIVGIDEIILDRFLV